MVMNMKVNGITERNIEWVYKLTQMMINMKVSGILDRKTGMVYSLTQKVINTRVFIIKINVMEKEL